jgi:hypothetical protein
MLGCRDLSRGARNRPVELHVRTERRGVKTPPELAHALLHAFDEVGGEPWRKFAFGCRREALEDRHHLVRREPLHATRQHAHDLLDQRHFRGVQGRLRAIVQLGERAACRQATVEAAVESSLALGGVVQEIVRKVAARLARDAFARVSLAQDLEIVAGVRQLVKANFHAERLASPCAASNSTAARARGGRPERVWGHAVGLPASSSLCVGEKGACGGTQPRQEGWRDGRCSRQRPGYAGFSGQSGGCVVSRRSFLGLSDELVAQVGA